MPIWRSPMSNSLAVASRNTLPSSSTASNSFTLPAGERSPAPRLAPLVQWSSAKCTPVWQAAVAPLVVQAIRAVEASRLMAMTLREPLGFVAAHGVRAHLRRALRGDGLVEPVHGMRAHDPVGDEPVGAAGTPSPPSASPPRRCRRAGSCRSLSRSASQSRGRSARAAARARRRPGSPAAAADCSWRRARCRVRWKSGRTGGPWRILCRGNAAPG